MHTTINFAKKKKDEWVGGVVEEGDLETLTAGKTKHFFRKSKQQLLKVWNKPTVSCICSETVIFVWMDGWMDE